MQALILINSLRLCELFMGREYQHLLLLKSALQIFKTIKTVLIIETKILRFCHFCLCVELFSLKEMEMATNPHQLDSIRVSLVITC